MCWFGYGIADTRTPDGSLLSRGGDGPPESTLARLAFRGREYDGEHGGHVPHYKRYGLRLFGTMRLASIRRCYIVGAR